MKALTLFLIAGLAFTSTSCNDACEKSQLSEPLPFSLQTKVTVESETGSPIPGMPLEVSYQRFRCDDDGEGGEPIPIEGTTNDDGVFLSEWFDEYGERNFALRNEKDYILVVIRIYAVNPNGSFPSANKTIEYEDVKDLNNGQYLLEHNYILN